MSLEDALREIVRDVVRSELAAAVESIRSEIRSAASARATTGYLSTDAAAEYAGVTAATIREWIKDGRLPRYRAGRHLRVRAADLDALLSTPLDDVDRAVVLELRRLDTDKR